jgi:subtilase family serine protease
MQKRLRAIIAVGSLALLLSATIGGFFLYRGVTAHAASASTSSLVSNYEKSTGPKVLLSGNTVNAVQFACQKANQTDRCYTPSQIQRAYNFLPLYKKHYEGQGETIVIIDISQDPTIASDLHNFDVLFGLPDPTLNVIAPYGTDPYDPGVATEITLDVEYAHAVAPLATIDLVLTPIATATTASQAYADFLQGVSYAVDNKLGTVISMSYGFPEDCVTPQVLAESHAIFAKAASYHITATASSGDHGATALNCAFSGYTTYRASSLPAAEPYNLSVGGTYLDTLANGTYLGETAWTQVSTNPDNGATGGGFSKVYGLPGYQSSAGIKGPGRGIPDVAYDGDPRSGVILYCTSCGFSSPLLVVGGTSAGAPQWAGIVALDSQYQGHWVGFINPTLYKIYTSSAYGYSFHDITIGNNSYTFEDVKGNVVTVLGYPAKFGWDATTGLGTPNVANLVPLVA